MIEARELYRFFHEGDDEVQALRGVTLRVARGEMVAVVGPSGAGKSTLLACLAGLDVPDGGTVSVDGRPISRRSEADRAEVRARHIGLLFQTGNLISHLTLEENIRFVQHRRGHEGRDALLHRLGLWDRRRALPAELSGGESVRAGLAVASANDPNVLLADEPTGEVDSVTEADVIGLLREQADGGAAVIVVTHSDAVASTADRSVRMEDGRLAP